MFVSIKHFEAFLFALLYQFIVIGCLQYVLAPKISFVLQTINHLLLRELLYMFMSEPLTINKLYPGNKVRVFSSSAQSNASIG